MKLFCRRGWLVALALALGLWLPWGALAQPLSAGALAGSPARQAGGLLIVEVGDLDTEAAERLVDLLEEPVQRLRLPEASEPRRALPHLLDSGARQAVLLDTRTRRAHVLERDGQLRTRVVEGEPTPYQMAFVASELLTLDAGHSPRKRLPRVVRLTGELSLELDSVFVGAAPLLRPRLGFDLWLTGRRAPRVYPLLGAHLLAPGAERTTTREPASLSVTRWDTLLRAGLVRPFGRLHGSLFAQARMGFVRAQYSGAFGISQRTVSFGLGGGTALALSLSRWFGLYAAVSAEYVPERSRYQVQGEPLLRERALLLAGIVGLMVLGPLR